MRIAYADPPYPGMSGFYKDHPDYGGEVDHAELVARMVADYDGWVLHTASTTLAQVLAVCPAGVRIAAWVKPFAAFKNNVSPAYAWEPVIFSRARKPPADLGTPRDWLAEGITLRRGLTGAKPEAVCRWVFDLLGMVPEDEMVDLFPGSGAVTAAWEAWRAAPRMPRMDYTGAGARAEASERMDLGDAA